MTQVRVLAGTRKGAFVLSSDEKREKWSVSGPHFGGWEIYHLKGSPVNQDRIYASQNTGWFGQLIQRSDDGGLSWQPVGNDFTYAGGDPGTHLWYDGMPRPWEFKRIWHLEPSLTEADTVYAGGEDAALYKSVDGGATWTELTALRKHASAPQWQPGAGGLCVHTIILQEPRIYVAISAAGTFRSDDAGETWLPVNHGLVSDGIPDTDAEVGHCVHHVEAHPTRPDTLFMQKHWDVMRSDDAGANWTEISGNLPSDFGFPISVTEAYTYVVPITSDSLHYPPDGKLQVWRTPTDGAGQWEPLTAGLPQENCFVNVYRDAMSTDALDETGIYFGTTGGQVYCSADAGDTWAPIVRDLPAVLSVEVQVLP